MCGYYDAMVGTLKIQKLLDCARIRVRVCAVITLLWAVKLRLKICFTVRL